VPAPPGGLGDAFCCHVPRLVELREDIQRELTKRSVAAATDAKTVRVWSGSLTLEKWTALLSRSTSDCARLCRPTRGCRNLPWAHASGCRRRWSTGASNG